MAYTLDDLNLKWKVAGTLNVTAAGLISVIVPQLSTVCYRKSTARCPAGSEATLHVAPNRKWIIFLCEGHFFMDNGGARLSEKPVLQQIALIDAHYVDPDAAPSMFGYAVFNGTGYNNRGQHILKTDKPTLNSIAIVTEREKINSYTPKEIVKECEQVERKQREIMKTQDMGSSKDGKRWIFNLNFNSTILPGYTYYNDMQGRVTSSHLYLYYDLARRASFCTGPRTTVDTPIQIRLVHQDLWNWTHP